MESKTREGVNNYRKYVKFSPCTSILLTGLGSSIRNDVVRPFVALNYRESIRWGRKEPIKASVFHEAGVKR